MGHFQLSVRSGARRILTRMYKNGLLVQITALHPKSHAATLSLGYKSLPSLQECTIVKSYDDWIWKTSAKYAQCIPINSCRQQTFRKALKLTKYLLVCMRGTLNSYEKRKLVQCGLESKKRTAAAPVCLSQRLFVVVPLIGPWLWSVSADSS